MIREGWIEWALLRYPTCKHETSNAVYILPQLYQYVTCMVHRTSELERLALKRVAIVLPALEPLRQGPVGREVGDKAANGRCMR